MRVGAHGIAADLLPGWEARITRRDPARAQAAGAVGTAHPVAHLATFPLPEDRGDYGSGAVDRMGTSDVLVVLVEHDPSSVGTALFRPVGLPRALHPGDFDPNGLQRTIAGQAGHQRFFTEAGRAFCLYVVLGAHASAAAVLPGVNALLRTVRIDPR